MENSELLIGLLVLLLFIALGGLALLWRRPASSQTEDPALAELRGQLTQLANAAGSQQQALASQLTEQSKRMEDSLSRLREQMGQSLTKQTQTTHENLTKLSERLVVIDQANSQIAELTGQVTQLHNILANKTERGAFGEVQLENLVRTVLPPNAYEFQVTLSTGKRADCILRLPNPPGPIVIDAKFPLEAWQALQNAENETARKAARKQLGIAVRGHVRDIQEKYIIAGETAESACLFLPSEAVYAELHANLPQIIEDSYQARVWIVSPTTMMATLNTVRAVLRDARMREQTAVIQAEIIKLIGDVVRLDQRVENLDKHFGLAQKDIREIQTSTGKITRRGQKIGEFDVIEDQEVNPGGGVDILPDKL
ncbi:MAG: DNA recombination protein RmuC, partial [Alphaproteobacteria bacterium]|nr:DNA recombination protein RmuC [Alphaproteobacteria bacterium]